MLVEFTYKTQSCIYFFFTESEWNFENEKIYIGTETLIDVSLCKIKLKLTIMFTEDSLRKRWREKIKMNSYLTLITLNYIKNMTRLLISEL